MPNVCSSPLPPASSPPVCVSSRPRDSENPWNSQNFALQNSQNFALEVGGRAQLCREKRVTRGAAAADSGCTHLRWGRLCHGHLAAVLVPVELSCCRPFSALHCRQRRACTLYDRAYAGRVNSAQCNSSYAKAITCANERASWSCGDPHAAQPYTSIWHRRRHCQPGHTLNPFC